MRRVVLLAAALAAAGPALAQTAPAPPPPVVEGVKAPPLDPKALALAHEILDIGIPPASRPAMFAGIMDALRAQMRDALAKMAGTGDPEADAIINRNVERFYAQMTAKMTDHLPEMFDAMANAYARQFSIDDLTQIRVFVGTPAGQHYFARSSTIMQDHDVIAANKRSMADIMTLLPDMQKQMIEELAAHLAKRDKARQQAKSNPS